MEAVQKFSENFTETYNKLEVGTGKGPFHVSGGSCHLGLCSAVPWGCESVLGTAWDGGSAGAGRDQQLPCSNLIPSLNHLCSLMKIPRVRGFKA